VRRRKHVYSYVTNAQWGILHAVAKGKSIPIWHIRQGSLRSLIDPEQRGWLRVGPEGDLLFTAAGEQAYREHYKAEVPMRDPQGVAYKSGQLSTTVQSLMSQRAVRSIEREVTRVISIGTP
jgi:hypothetical protein